MQVTDNLDSFLVIQTAFIGDVILATSLVENLRKAHPDAKIDFLLRKGNEGLLTGHPYIREVLVLDKKKNKFQNIWRLLRTIRSRHYGAVINVQRFAVSGFLSAFSGARYIAGFDKNPFSPFFDRKVKHHMGDGVHETQRNHNLIATLTASTVAKPVLYPSQDDFSFVAHYKNEPYLCIAPTSVWYTKQYPSDGWVRFIKDLSTKDVCIFLLGGPADTIEIEKIISSCPDNKAVNLAGKLSFLQSAALMKDALMNYVNDSAPMHIASAMNAPVTAVYCSTVPEFGFGPLSDVSFVVETPEKLTCRPCGNHGHRSCPEGHFACANTINTGQLLSPLFYQQNH
mgnify:CR=1 FL=1